ncbi:thiamine phosphate synthase [Clostridium brassicae]|uniref:Thiamine-phosphate synthase n=1 Tax=Clostridium brassicae TaxID=2999072 RepID=A0ABT4DCL0_9CLOT|nr:thiamine phosphate synthase [Clostridium brassicae]MCY6960022.1 thiamine phosphate synthase [Clostridium brassicae]
MLIDYSLYLVTDRSFLNGRGFKECVEQAIEGGVTLIQLREKNISTREFLAIAFQIKEITSKYNVPLLINDRIDIALAVDADGVHLGQSDMPINSARKILGENKIIGISANTLNEALEAESCGANYLGLGPIFYTTSKKDINTPIGLDGLKEITKKIKIPCVAIGGINSSNTKEIMESGVNGISVISAILGEEYIKQASEKLNTIIKSI